MSALEEFGAAWRRRDERCADAVGYIGLDTPVELIRAAGFSAVRVVAEPRSSGADSFAEGGGSPLLRGLAAAVLDGPYAFLKRLVIAPTPSSYGWLYAFLRELKRSGDGRADLDVYLFDLNHGLAPAMAAVRRDAVAGLQDQLLAWGGQSGDLGAAIEAANRRRGLLRQVEGLRVAGKLTGAQALAVFGGAELLSDEALERLIAERADAPAVSGRRTIYSGAETLDDGLYAQLEAAGALIVADDQDGGSRPIGPDVQAAGDPLGALAERYLARDPAPAKSSIAARTAYLMGLAARTGAERVVFNLPAHDHPPAWELPALRAALQGAGVEVEVLRNG